MGFKSLYHTQMGLDRDSSGTGGMYIEIINPEGIIVSSDFVPSDESAKSNYRFF